MGAHVRPPPVPGQPALEPVLRKALVKDRTTATRPARELIEAAAARPRPRARPGPLRAAPAGRDRRRRASCCGERRRGRDAGRRRERRARPSGTAWPRSGEATGSTRSRRRGAAEQHRGRRGRGLGANTENETIARIDPKTKAGRKRFEPEAADRHRGRRRGRLGRQRRRAHGDQASISRVDPGPGGHAHREAARTPDNGGWDPNCGFPGIAVGPAASGRQPHGNGCAASTPTRASSWRRSKCRSRRRRSPPAGRASGLGWRQPDRCRSTRARTRSSADRVRQRTRCRASQWAPALSGRLERRAALARSTRAASRSRARSTWGPGRVRRVRRRAVWTANYVDGTGLPHRSADQHGDDGPRGRPAGARGGRRLGLGQHRGGRATARCPPRPAASRLGRPQARCADRVRHAAAGRRRRSARHGPTRSAACSRTAATGRASSPSATGRATT